MSKTAKRRNLMSVITKSLTKKPLTPRSSLKSNVSLGNWPTRMCSPGISSQSIRMAASWKALHVLARIASVLVPVRSLSGDRETQLWKMIAKISGSCMQSCMPALVSRCFSSCDGCGRQLLSRTLDCLVLEVRRKYKGQQRRASPNGNTRIGGCQLLFGRESTSLLGLAGTREQEAGRAIQGRY
jgi:hypothetical protein